MTDTDEGLVPAMYEHCCNVYAKMKESATEETVTVLANELDNDARSDVSILVYEGFFSQLFQELALSPPYYTKVRNLLIRMQCIEQIRRGGGNAKSRWRLVREPNEEIFRVANDMKDAPSGKVAGLEQAVRALNARLQKVEAAMGIGQ
jgi:hypothetical protein